jgi:hypothetical protein
MGLAGDYRAYQRMRQSRLESLLARWAVSELLVSNSANCILNRTLDDVEAQSRSNALPEASDPSAPLMGLIQSVGECGPCPHPYHRLLAEWACEYLSPAQPLFVRSVLGMVSSFRRNYSRVSYEDEYRKSSSRHILLEALKRVQLHKWQISCSSK